VNAADWDFILIVGFIVLLALGAIFVSLIVSILTKD